MSAKNRQVCIFADEVEVINYLASTIQQSANEVLQEPAVCFFIGGSAAKLVCEAVTKIQSDWSRWRVAFCDERLVPSTHEESTYAAYAKYLQNSNPTLLNNFIKVDTSLPVDEAARDYEQKLHSLMSSEKGCSDLKWPHFDILVLGVGEDGHTASLFPSHPLLDEASKWVAPISDSPKPPPSRVTLTLPAIWAAGKCIFPVIGGGKADILKRILCPGDGGENLPVHRVMQSSKNTLWILDSKSAEKLEEFF
ncbi:unnamed protein product [Darwinula stevensoni]|uniref:6-phosphogluconolactonase n=1 Tax=Darwinula stevensoni TaxID=69355 RepID=A0A7R8X6Z4_9CRUS|nr:unnamed protein product [Darwinula stevensoni]CAG0881787.1 unnamed protein product [Darwinula stevensoni]